MTAVTSAMVLAACDAYRKSERRKPVNGSFVEDMRKALDAAMSVAPWQPIETAPRDGTTVLLWAPHWHQAQTGWTFGTDAWQGCRKDSYEKPPTHWQPLPIPPASPATPIGGLSLGVEGDQGSSVAGLPAPVAEATATDALHSAGKEDK